MKKVTTADRLNEIIKLRNYKQIQIVELCQPFLKKYGVKMGRNDISQYVSGKVVPGQEKLSVLAEALNVSETWLMGYPVPMERNITNIIPLQTVNRIPLVGTIACGTPVLAQENIEANILLPENINATFALRCKGDSMIEARINDGDIVYIRQQPTVENGEIAAVLIGNEATLKRFYDYGDTVVLQPENRNYEQIVFRKEEINDIKILGKAVAFLSDI